MHPHPFTSSNRQSSRASHPPEKGSPRPGTASRTPGNPNRPSRSPNLPPETANRPSGIGSRPSFQPNPAAQNSNNQAVRQKRNIQSASQHAQPKTTHSHDTRQPHPSPLTPAPSPQPGPGKKKRKSPGIIAQDTLDAIAVATDCFRTADEDPNILAALTDREWTGQADLGQSIARCGSLINEITGKRSARTARTADELAARQQLIVALNPIIIAARDKYPKGSSERSSYGLGEDLDSAGTADLLALANYAFTQLTGTPPPDTLPGLKPDEITLLGTLYSQYKDADWAQSKAQRTAEQALNQLHIEVDGTLTPLRHKFQNKADLAFPHTDKANRITRKSLHLPPDKRATD